MLPSIPAWTELHPAVVHFPVALLPVAALLAALALVRGRFAAGLRLAAAVVMVIGAAGAFVAVETGEAAAGIHRTLPPEPAAVVEQHGLAGETTRTVSAALAATYLVLLVLPAVTRRRITPGLLLAVHLVFLACYLAALLLLVRSAALGGELVHRWGVRGLTEAGATP